MNWNLSDNKHSFVLRYYLPCMPQYDGEITERRIEELLVFCKKYCVDAVMFYVDLNPYWYYMPDTKEHSEYVAGIMKKVASTLKKEGISYQINYQNLVGSWDGNADHRKDLPWEYYQDEFGESSYGVACMIGEKFRAQAGKKLRMFAETKPDVIWIDDDLRIHNHKTGIHNSWNGKSGGEGIDFGCFCDEHIRRFNIKHNTDYKREELVEACLKNCEIRKMWQNFQGDCYEDTAKWIYATVSGVSPETKMAIMTSVPDVHSVEGREWGRFLMALSGGKTPYIRAHIGPYAEGNPRDFAMAHSLLERLKKNIDAQYNGNIEYCPEIENTRFTRYSKSISATKFQMALSAFLGCRGTTLSIFDLEGCITAEEPEFGDMLLEIKTFCDLMNIEKMSGYENCGIAFLTSPDRLPEKNCSRFSDMLPSRYMDEIFAKAGIPIDYCVPEKIGAYNGFVLDRDGISMLCDDEIKNILSKNIFLDGGAADELIKRGFSHLLGIKSLKKNGCIVSSEMLHTEKRSDKSEVIVPCRILGNHWFETEMAGAEELSSFVTPLGEKYPGFLRYENELGGKVFIYVAENDFGDGFFSNYRIKLLRKICKEINPDILLSQFNSYGVSAMRKHGSNTAVFFANLGTDVCEDLKIPAPEDAKECILVTSDGKKETVKINNKEVVIEHKMPIYSFGVVIFS